MMEWFNNNQQQEEQHMQVQMERQNQNGVGVGGALNVKVMTDEQMEMLRRQISVYATICEQLVEMHQSLSSTQDLSGMMFLNPYYDPLVASGGQKIASRQRWTPTPAQLQILEQIYEQGHGTPGKKRIKEITTELTQHGQITETNVYNWFQNRRARTKRKQNAESEMESPNEMKTLPECSKSVENSSPRAENMFFGGHDHIGIGQLIGKMDLPETFSPYCHLVDMTSLDDASNESLLCLNRTLSK